jgi:hypothetical protein
VIEEHRESFSAIVPAVKYKSEKHQCFSDLYLTAGKPGGFNRRLIVLKDNPRLKKI